MRFADPLRHLKQLQRRIERRLSRRDPLLELQRRNLYILPTGFGSLWLCGSGVLYVVGINSRSNGPVLLSHLLLALILLSLFLTHRNLEGLELRSLDPHASCADEPALLPLLCNSRRARASLSLRWLEPTSGANALLVHLQAGRTRLELPWRPPGRGLQQPGRLLISTTAPLGLFRCWSFWEPPVQFAIAPARRRGPVQQPEQGFAQHAQQLRRQGSGSDDFQELTPLRPEEGMQRVAWKSAAKGQGLHGKRFSADQENELWLAPVAGIPLEQALEHVCERLERSLDNGARLGLVLPGGVCIHPDRGAAHRERCLIALASVPQR